MPPDVPGVLTAGEALQTARAIASVQRADGCIPWEDGRHADPWNHVEAAMALDVAGLHRAAARAYRWLADHQRSDGSWAASYRDGRVDEAFTDANFCAYTATGVWPATATSCAAPGGCWTRPSTASWSCSSPAAKSGGRETDAAGPGRRRS